MKMANSELDKLAMWDGLGVQLRESWLAQGTPATPSAMLTRTRPSPAPFLAWGPWPLSPHAPLPPPLLAHFLRHRRLPFLHH
jgi:hypothetical protein